MGRIDSDEYRDAGELSEALRNQVSGALFFWAIGVPLFLFMVKDDRAIGVYLSLPYMVIAVWLAGVWLVGAIADIRSRLTERRQAL